MRVQFRNMLETVPEGDEQAERQSQIATDEDGAESGSNMEDCTKEQWERWDRSSTDYSQESVQGQATLTYEDSMLSASDRSIRSPYTDAQLAYLQSAQSTSYHPANFQYQALSPQCGLTGGGHVRGQDGVVSIRANYLPYQYGYQTYYSPNPYHDQAPTAHILENQAYYLVGRAEAYQEAHSTAIPTTARLTSMEKRLSSQEGAVEALQERLNYAMVDAAQMRGSVEGLQEQIRAIRGQQATQDMMRAVSGGGEALRAAKDGLQQPAKHGQPQPIVQPQKAAHSPPHAMADDCTRSIAGGASEQEKLGRSFLRRLLAPAARGTYHQALQLFNMLDLFAIMLSHNVLLVRPSSPKASSARSPQAASQADHVDPIPDRVLARKSLGGSAIYAVLLEALLRLLQQHKGKLPLGLKGYATGTFKALAVVRTAVVAALGYLLLREARGVCDYGAGCLWEAGRMLMEAGVYLFGKRGLGEGAVDDGEMAQCVESKCSPTDPVAASG